MEENHFALLLQTRKITLNLLTKTLEELAVSSERIRILLKVYLLETKTELGESDT